MEEETPVQGWMKWALGAIGLGAIAAAVTIPKVGVWVALFILLLALLLLGGYFLWWRARKKKESEGFKSGLGEGASVLPQGATDPNLRKELDSLRRKFQDGLEEFEKSGKSVYRLPWYVFIGESGAGKTEAIRSALQDECPPKLRDYVPGPGGTVNMNWWFTNKAVILDTAGKMVMPEAGHLGDTKLWRDFLRLVRKNRPHCPINGLFLVLSVKSLIEDSSEEISRKARLLAQQLELIQDNLDVRFPVFLLVTKCDLLAGFREFSESIDDPVLQHQMLGWSNPDPLDAPFEPKQVEQHLVSVAARLRRRRMALIRGASGSSESARSSDTSRFYQLGRGPVTPRRLDVVDSLFALPESLLRLEPRLRRYLQTIFVAEDEWSSKRPFIRGIYFTSAMREGTALDEAISLATGLTLDQLPEDRKWESRAFFLRDLFLEKAFLEKGLVTRATNTLNLLRRRQLAIFGTAGVALLLLLLFSWFAYRKLDRSVRTEARFWQAGTNWVGVRQSSGTESEWSLPIITNTGSGFAYAGDDKMPGFPEMTVAGFHKKLSDLTATNLEVSLIFKPLRWFGVGKIERRAQAQSALFEGGVLRPLIFRTRAKMEDAKLVSSDSDSLTRLQNALQALIQLEADAMIEPASAAGFLGRTNAAEQYLTWFLSYLTETNRPADSNLVKAFVRTYAKGKGEWPPTSLLLGDTLAKNAGINSGLDKLRRAGQESQDAINQQLTKLNAFADALYKYYAKELDWLKNSKDHPCEEFEASLRQTKPALDESSSNPLATNLASRYSGLESKALAASASPLAVPVDIIWRALPPTSQSKGLIKDVQNKLREFATQAGQGVRSSRNDRGWLTELDTNCFSTSSIPCYELRWHLYNNACALEKAKVRPTEEDVGTRWAGFTNLENTAKNLRGELAKYHGLPNSAEIEARCNLIASNSIQTFQREYVEEYVSLVSNKFSGWSNRFVATMENVTNARAFFGKVGQDLDSCGSLGPQEIKLRPIRDSLPSVKKAILLGLKRDFDQRIGFPVRVKSELTMNLQGLTELRELADGLSAELTNNVWEDKSDEFNSLQNMCKNYRPVLDMLVTPEGKPTEWELLFVAPQKNSPDYTITTVFKCMDVILNGSKRSSGNLTAFDPGSANLLGQGTIDLPISINFKGDCLRDTSGPPLQEPNWWLPRMMGAGGDPHWENNGRWRFRASPPGEASKSEGSFVFEARMLKRNDKDLWPKYEDWAK